MTQLDTATSLADTAVTIENAARNLGYLDAAVMSFAAGDEEAMAPAIELALRSGNSLADLYEAIQRTISATAYSPRSRMLVEAEMDERFVRLVARTRPNTTGRQDWQAYVVSTQRLGTPAGIAHVLTDAGLPAMVIRASSLNVTGDDDSVRADRSNVARFIVLDGARTNTESVGTTMALLRTNRSLTDAVTQFFLVTEPGWHGFPAANVTLPGIVRVDSLQNLLLATGFPVPCPLTVRERQVLAQVAVGSTNAQIARSLSVAVSTIKTYLERIQSRLDSTDRASAVAIAIRSGWI